MNAAYDRTIERWAKEFRVKLLPEIKHLIAQTKFDLIWGPCQEEDYPGFTTACKMISDALEAADLPSELYLDADTETWQEKEPEGEQCEECEGYGKVECEIGFASCDVCAGRGGFDPAGDWWHADSKRDLLNVLVGKELAEYLL